MELWSLDDPLEPLDPLEPVDPLDAPKRDEESRSLDDPLRPLFFELGELLDESLDESRMPSPWLF